MIADSKEGNKSPINGGKNEGVTLALVPVDIGLDRIGESNRIGIEQGGISHHDLLSVHPCHNSPALDDIRIGNRIQGKLAKILNYRPGQGVVALLFNGGYVRGDLLHLLGVIGRIPNLGIAHC